MRTLSVGSTLVRLPKLKTVAAATLLACSTLSLCAPWDSGLLQVDNSGRYLTNGNKPFFWLGDTAWQLFHELNREDAKLYLEDRRKKGFNVIQAVLLAEQANHNSANAYDDLPLENGNAANRITTPGSSTSKEVEYEYWDHVDWIVTEAEKRGMYVAMLPAWGRNRVVLNESNQRSVTMENVVSYSRFLAECKVWQSPYYGQYSDCQ